MYKTISIKRGLDLKLKGAVNSMNPAQHIEPKRIALVPDDFEGFTPKLCKKAGEKVLKGEALLHDKVHSEIQVVSPVAGTIAEVVRGERRKILRVVVEAEGDGEVSYPTDPRQALLSSGLWVMMRQRPYDIIPSPDVRPRDIFITTFDSSPLAPDLLSALRGRDAEMARGLEALLQMTNGYIYIGVRPADKSATESYAKRDRIVVVEINGPHPAGNAGTLIAVLAPINKGETVWTLDITTVYRLGHILLHGKADWATDVALTGSEVADPHIISTVVGTEIEPLIDGNLKESGHHIRIISGNVLTGKKTDRQGYLRYPYRQITVIPEGDDVDEFMGWASMSTRKMSQSRSFLSKLFPGRSFEPDARINGGRRAMIMSGQYEKVMPLDIMPEHLIKAMIARDIDKMEALGAYEVAPEDFALSEYVDPSKLELQKIVRESLDYLRHETE